MKNKIREIIVVEGKTDIDFLSTFLDADFYQVHGSAISNDDINFLYKASKERGIVVLTDPDFPGERIRNIIRVKIPNSKHGFVNKELSIKNNKVGVAESTRDEVIRALNNLITYCNKQESIKYCDLFELQLVGNYNSNQKRENLCKLLNIGYSNPKQLLLKLNSLNITKDEIVRLLNAK